MEEKFCECNCAVRIGDVNNEPEHKCETTVMRFYAARLMMVFHTRSFDRAQRMLQYIQLQFLNGVGMPLVMNVRNERMPPMSLGLGGGGG